MLKRESETARERAWRPSNGCNRPSLGSHTSGPVVGGVAGSYAVSSSAEAFLRNRSRPAPPLNHGASAVGAEQSEASTTDAPSLDTGCSRDARRAPDLHNLACGRGRSGVNGPSGYFTCSLRDEMHVAHGALRAQTVKPMKIRSKIGSCAALRPPVTVSAQRQEFDGDFPLRESTCQSDNVRSAESENASFLSGATPPPWSFEYQTERACLAVKIRNLTGCATRA